MVSPTQDGGSERPAPDVPIAERLRRAEETIRRLEERERALLQANWQLRVEATTDDLTGLKNRRYFREAAEKLFAFSIRRGLPLSVVMVDLDRFKSYNDSHGHPAGDDLLRAVASILRQNIRREDDVARYGGEEFVLLLPDTDVHGALELSERLRLAVAHDRRPLQPVTASFGVATRTASTVGSPRLIEEADRALYHSKACGRNRVTHVLHLGGGVPGSRPASG